MRFLGSALLTVLTLVASAQPGPYRFPPGTTTFVDTKATAVVAAPDGGVWVATAHGISHYTAAGVDATHATPYARQPQALALAADGSIWFATKLVIGRMSTGGVVLEQYPVPDAFELAVAGDGALWYHDSENSGTGRIANGIPIAFPLPAQAWSLAPAAGSDMWVLEHGVGKFPDSLFRLTPAGIPTEFPLGHDLLLGELQPAPDGTLYVGLGLLEGNILHLDANGQTLEVLRPAVRSAEDTYLADADGNLWTGGYSILAYGARSGSPRVAVAMPGDPRHCERKPVYLYRPLAIDASGGVWITVKDAHHEQPWLPPCLEAAPPPMPDLIRVDAAQFLASARRNRARLVRH